MIIIGFTNRTSKILPRIFCRKFRHVAVIVPHQNSYVMYQFVRRMEIAQIPLVMRDIKILKQHGWFFICLPQHVVTKDFARLRAYTCVQMAKKAIGVPGIWVQTPYALYQRLKSLEN